MNNDNRIHSHPILGDLDEKKQITFYFDGKPVQAIEGEMIAAALFNAGK